MKINGKRSRNKTTRMVHVALIHAHTRIEVQPIASYLYVLLIS